MVELLVLSVACWSVVYVQHRSLKELTAIRRTTELIHEQVSKREN